MTSPGSYDAIVIGGGHNGLVCAAYLARAGLRVVVLERRESLGGALDLVHTVGRLREAVVRDLGLAGHGLSFIRPDVRAFAPQPDGRSITLWSDPGRTASDLRAWSPKDAGAYPEFDRKVRALASFVAHLDASTPPDLKRPSVADAFGGLRLVRAFRKLGTVAGREILRVMPMAVADFVGEAFETDPLRGALATRGVRYAAMGPWSAGTTAVLLADSAGNDGGAAGQTAFARGGTGALAAALASAAQRFGVEIRTNAPVAALTTTEGRASGVALSSGEELRASVVVSSLDPKRTLLQLVDPVLLGPTLSWRAGNVRLPGVVAHVRLTLEKLPRFAASGGDDPARLSGRIVIAPGIDYLERAFDASKYGRISDEPYLEATIPTLSDPSEGLAPEDGHVMSVIVQWAPYHLRAGDWTSEREGLGDLVMKTLETYAPGLSDLVVGRQVITPLDLEQDYGLTEGHPLHGEPALDQFFAWRPLLGLSRYRLVPPGLYLCGAGAHPGGGITGGPGQNAAREILADRKPGRR
jgi:phytoene dehydrogenase-like protein